MGGNGQFNRLAALDAIADGDGPWRNRLTEDQDLGLRLLAAGWKSHQEMRAVVEQQGVPRLRPLLRQRTRWAQGNLQAFGLLRAMWRSPFPRSARAGEVLYLMMPLWQAIVGAALSRDRPRRTGARLGDTVRRRSSPRCTCSASRTPCSDAWRHATRPAGAVGSGRSWWRISTRCTPGCCSPSSAIDPRQLGTRREWSRTDRVALEPVEVADEAERFHEESRAA